MVRIGPGDIPNKFPEGLIIKIIFSIFLGSQLKSFFLPRTAEASRVIRAICIYYIIISNQSELSND